MKKTSLYICALFILVTGVFSLSAFAQNEKLISVGKKGKFHIDSPLRVGDKLLKPGMYQVQHQEENNEHFIIFRKVEMGYRENMGNQKIGGEVIRVKCLVELVNAQNKNAKILARQNAANEREFIEVWFKGEKIKHILTKN